MKRSKLNFIVDLAILFLFLVVAFTGFYMYIFIPSGVPQGRNQIYLGLTKATWTMINRVSIILTIAVLVHTLLHYKWLSCMTSNLLTNSKECEK